MTARPWMPLYVADYLADTGHLSCLEHGAYVLLIMHYWQNGSLPGQDISLARICRISAKQFKAIRPTVSAFFTPDWKHKRIEEEILRANETMQKRSAAGLIGAYARHGKRMAIASEPHGNRTANGQQSDTPSPSPSPERKKDAASRPLKNGNGASHPTPEQRLFQRGKEVLGDNAGGLIAKLLKVKKDSVSEATAAIETAVGKQDPREYIGRIVRGGDLPPSEQTWDPRL